MTVEATAEAPAVPGRASLRDWFILIKPGIMLALLISCVTAMVVAAGAFPPLTLTLAVIAGGAMASGSAAALNNILEHDRDAVMRRTRKRALPSHRIRVSHATLFAVALAMGSTLILSAYANYLAALLAAGGILFYAVVYTHWLKPLTPQNIVIGGAAGCFPALVGWAAVRGEIGVGAIVLAAIVFLWTPPHFWSLALLYRDDYATAKIPMLPVTHGEEVTRRQIVAYSVVLLGASLLLVPLGVLGWVYLLMGAPLGIAFVVWAVRLFRTREKAVARRLFHYSNWYLALLGLAMVADVMVRTVA